MKTVILAGGFGTRISEESHLIPKPMIEIGERPILWHIMKSYYSYGHKDFIICCGYKAFSIKNYFSTYYLRGSDITFDFSKGGKVDVHQNYSEQWRVTLVDTGLKTMTGGRIKRIDPYIGGETFMLTYGDGVSDVNIEELIRFHKSHGKMATMTAVRPEGRFGSLEMSGNEVKSFREKSRSDTGWINAGYMVLEPEVIDLIEGDDTMFERRPMEKLAEMGELMVYKHEGYWQCMDTLKDKQTLEELWNNGQAPWRRW